MARTPRKKLADLPPYTPQQIAEALHVAMQRAYHTPGCDGLPERRRNYLRHVSNAVAVTLAGDGDLKLSWQELVLTLVGAALYVQLANGVVGEASEV